MKRKKEAGVEVEEKEETTEEIKKETEEGIKEEAKTEVDGQREGEETAVLWTEDHLIVYIETDTPSISIRLLL